MYSYIKGCLTEINFDHIVLENCGIGYQIYVANPFDYAINQDYVIYTHQNIRDDAHLLFGFKTRDEKNLFMKLISVKGIGPKTAVGILATASVDGVIGAIDDENVAYLKKIPGIGPKAAQQIILDLKGKLAQKMVSNNNNLEEAIAVLKALGYKSSEISIVEKKLSIERMDTNDYVKKALSLLMK